MDLEGFNKDVSFQSKNIILSWDGTSLELQV
jgi:hypothetical protein